MTGTQEGPLQIQLRGEDVLAVAGELDLATSPQLQGAIEKLLPESGRDLRIDLSGISFCDSTGIGTLIWAHRALSINGQVVLVNPSRVLDRLIHLTGLQYLLDGSDQQT